jgi:hypothetical protein
MRKRRIWWVLGISLIGLGVLIGIGTGWAQQLATTATVTAPKRKKHVKVATKPAKPKPLTAAQKRRRAADRTDGVGKVLATRAGNSRVPYQLANDHVKLYDSLKHVNNRYHVTVDGDEEEISAPIKVVIAKLFDTEKGTYCLIQNVHHVAVNRPFKAYAKQTWTNLKPNNDWGYIALKDLRRTTYRRSVTTLPKVPYYLTSFEGKNPSNLAMNLGNTIVHAWSNVPGTVFRAFAHDTDTLLNQQFYAVKRLVRTDGRRYLLLKTASGQTIGWLPEESQLVQGQYHDAATVLLTPKSTETVTQAVQHPIKRTESSGYRSRSRVTWVTDRQHQLKRALILTAMNTPIKVTFRAGQAQQVAFYQPNRRRNRVIKVHFKKQSNQRTYDRENEYGDAGSVTVYRNHKRRLVSFSDGDDPTDEEGYTASGVLYHNRTATFKSGIWSNQDD